jgi:hypothetical protein
MRVFTCLSVRPASVCVCVCVSVCTYVRVESRCVYCELLNNWGSFQRLSVSKLVQTTVYWNRWNESRLFCNSQYMYFKMRLFICLLVCECVYTYVHVWVQEHTRTVYTQFIITYLVNNAGTCMSIHFYIFIKSILTWYASHFRSDSGIV